MTETLDIFRAHGTEEAGYETTERAASKLDFKKRAPVRLEA